MLFQTLDDKNNCVGYFLNDQLHFHKPLPDDLSKTWNYSAFLKGKDIDYAQLYCEGKSLDDVCPEYLKEEWESVVKRLKSFVSSCFEAKVSLNENCFFDLTPKQFLINYCRVRNQITEYAFKTHNKPLEYQFYKRFTELLYDIKHRDLNINLDNMQKLLAKEEAKAFYKKISTINKNIVYNMFGSITGRLTINKNSFPILTFPKQYREILVPKNDLFVVLDMNAAELRTAMALAKKPQVKGDLHQWSSENVFKGQLDRSNAKSTATAWLYDSHSTLAAKYDAELSTIYDKQGLLDQYWIDGFIHTPYNRKIEADRHHAISYLNQSTFIDLFHRQIIKVDDLLKSKKSFISFMVHDELVLDLANEDKYLLMDIIKTLQDTPYGIFPVNIKVGKNYGNLKRLNLKVD